MHFEAPQRRLNARRVRNVSNPPLLAREGIPLSRYRWPELIPGSILGAVLWAYLRVVSWTSREILFHHPARIPSNAILFLYSGDTFLAPSAPRFWRSVDRGLSWLGFHGFASYVMTFGAWWAGKPACRTDERLDRKPMEQVLDYLRFRRLGRFALRTDLGAKPGRVRASLVDLALETRRPVVAVRQRCDRAIRFRGHSIPLPFCTVATTISEPLYPEELAQSTAGGSSVGREIAQTRLQRLIDRI